MRQLMEHDEGVSNGGTPIDWAREDLAIDQHQIYDLVPLHPAAIVVLPSDYATAKWPIVAQQLTEGGLRLAKLLNQLLS